MIYNIINHIKTLKCHNLTLKMLNYIVWSDAFTKNLQNQVKIIVALETLENEDKKFVIWSAVLYFLKYNL